MGDSLSYDCVNEAIINAPVHNDWTVSEPQISFYSDRLEILSHGGLPNGLTKEEFYRGISKPGNLKLMKIFSDLDIVEHTGHGVPTIIETYGKDVFDISDNYIMVTIPFDKAVTDEMKFQNVGIKQTEQTILEILIKDPKATQNSISEKIGKTPKTVERNLQKLVDKGYIIRQGSRKSGQWKVIK